MNRYSGDPRWLYARFSSECKCGHVIKKDERIYYYPNGKTALCKTCGEKAAAEFNAAAQDEAMMAGQTW